MSSVSEDLKTKKNCFLSLRNKKLNNFDGALKLINEFAESGYYFDKIAYIAYDNANDIVRAVWDGKDNYENLIIYCPFEMKKTLTHFLTHIYAAEFDETGVLSAGDFNAFMLFSDGENSLNVANIVNNLDKKYGITYAKAYVKTVGANSKIIHGAITKAIAELFEESQIKNLIDFNVSDNFGDSKIEIVYSDKLSKCVFDKIFRSLVTSLDEYVYAVDNFTLAERLFQLLQLRRLKIGVAESFTGGGIAKKLVEVNGISEVYTEGLNTYSNEAKMFRLGVKAETLRMFGAVSEQTAREMAEGLLSGGNCDVSIATTGIAGPKSDNTLKPVGLIYIAVGTKENIRVYKYNLNGDRNSITSTAINLALFHTFKMLK